MSVYFSVVAVVFGLLYNKYFKWRYKRHYLNFIRENHQARIGIESEIQISDEHILTKDKTGEGKIKIEEIEEVNDLKDHLLVQISSGFTLIIPKRHVKDLGETLGVFRQLGRRVTDESNWKW